MKKLMYFTNINPKDKTLIGVNKKIISQIDVFKNYFEVYQANILVYGVEFIDGKGSNQYEYKYSNLDIYKQILSYIDKNSIEMIYIRFKSNNDMFFNEFLEELNLRKIHVGIEFPTFPYLDHVFDDESYERSKYYFENMRGLIDFSVNYNQFNEILGKKSYSIKNGVDICELNYGNKKDKENINFLFVGNISKWHGLDRVIKGFNNYITTGKNNVRFHIVGEGEEFLSIKKLVRELHLEKYIKLHGWVIGEKLKSFYKDADIVVGGVGFHRIKVENGSTLKVKESLVRLIPTIVSHKEFNLFDFEKLIIKVSPTENDIAIEAVLKQYELLKAESFFVDELYNKRNLLSWDESMKEVISEMMR